MSFVLHVPRGDADPSVFGAARGVRGLVVAFRGHLTDPRDVARLLGDPSLAHAEPELVVARAYAELGPTFARALVGEYAFALIDPRARRVLAGRDAIGIGRLWVREEAGAVTVTDDLRALEATLGLPELDPDGLATFVAHGGIARDGSTVYRGLRSLPAGHVVLADGGGARVVRYWAPRDEPEELPDAALDERVRALVGTAVRGALPADEAAWVDVSGGIDSAVVAAVAVREARVHGRPAPVAFSVVHARTPEADESGWQDRMVGSLGVRHVRFDVDACPEYEEPDQHYLASPTNGLMQGARIRATRELMERHRVGVRLAGLGGDQVFCGDDFAPVHLGGLLRAGRWSTFARELGGWLARGDRSLVGLLDGCVARPLHARGAARPISAPGWVGRSVAERILDRPSAERRRSRCFGDAGREVMWREVTDLVAALEPCGTPWTSRFPLLHRPLVELLLAVGPGPQVRPDGDRIVQRRAFRALVPDAILDRRGKGDGTPRFLRGLREGWSRARRWTAGRRLAELGLVDPARFAGDSERLRHGLLGDDLPFWLAALSLEMWLDARERARAAPAPAILAGGAR